MFIPVCRKYFTSSLISTCFLGISIADETVLQANVAALTFAHKWLTNPKMYVGMILPHNYPLRAREIVKLTKILNAPREGRNTYFMVLSNVTYYNTIRHIQNELVWYPFGLENYEIDCSFLDSARYDELYKKNFLFLYESTVSTNFSFESCKVRFDANLVIYRKKKNSKTLMQFEEIYKIEENENMLQKNILAEVVYGKKELMSSGLNVFIWNRRKSLNGRVFKALSINGISLAMYAKRFTDSEGKLVTQHSGHVADIMRHLMKTLNFSLIQNVSNKMSYDDIVKEVGSGRYDIGYNIFSQNLLRRSIVDFSLGLVTPNYRLFYVKGNTNFDMSTYLHPFALPTWRLLTTYTVLLVSGFVFVKIIDGNDNRNFTLQKIWDSLQNGFDIVLRSLIAKRQRSEPLIFSSKISFLVLVFAGFLIFNMYRAVLIANLAAEEDTPPIRNVKELRYSDYSLAVRQGSAMETFALQYFFDATTELEKYHLAKAGKITRFSGSPFEFADLMVESDPTASKTILFHFSELIEESPHYPCKLSHIQGFSRKASTSGVIFTKGWPWTHFFNYHLLTMKETGLIERFYQINMAKNRELCPGEHTINRIVKEPRPVDTSKTFSLYVALLIGLAISLLCLFTEKLNVKLRQFMSD